MSCTAHHNALVVMRLAAIMVFLGLVAVPVECASVYGPHSVFVSAQEVSALRGPGPDEANETPSSHLHHHMVNPGPGNQPARHHAPGTSSAAGPQTDVSAPSPTSMSLDAAVSLCLLQTPLRPLVAAPRSQPNPALDLPGGRFLPAPEPPPPISRY